VYSDTELSLRSASSPVLRATRRAQCRRDPDKILAFKARGQPSMHQNERSATTTDVHPYTVDRVVSNFFLYHRLPQPDRPTPPPPALVFICDVFTTRPRTEGRRGGSMRAPRAIGISGELYPFKTLQMLSPLDEEFDESMIGGQGDRRDAEDVMRSETGLRVVWTRCSGSRIRIWNCHFQSVERTE